LDVNQFRRFWQQHFSDCPPVSWLFKHRLAECWFRFHSLPESKRYAEDDAEFAELLRRQNTVLLDVIGTDNECVLVSGSYDDSPLIENLRSCSALGKFEFQDFDRLSKQDFDPIDLEPDEEPAYLTLFYATHKLERGSLDEILLCVADEKIANFFVVSYERQHIFAPYDGGVDIILKDAKERDEFKAKYRDWLLSHPAGL
jgi:hypothetical protein